jgi:hypothetical protein
VDDVALASVTKSLSVKLGELDMEGAVSWALQLARSPQSRDRLAALTVLQDGAADSRAIGLGVISQLACDSRSDVSVGAFRSLGIRLSTSQDDATKSLADQLISDRRGVGQILAFLAGLNVGSTPEIKETAAFPTLLSHPSPLLSAVTTSPHSSELAEQDCVRNSFNQDHALGEQ